MIGFGLMVAAVYGSTVGGAVYLVMHGHPWFALALLIMGASFSATAREKK